MSIATVRVVNLRDGLVPGTFLYVGRALPGWGLRGHPLANPFKLPKPATAADREECLRKYREWLSSKPDHDALLLVLAVQVRETGKPLACWCAPLACHADVLAEKVRLILEGG